MKAEAGRFVAAEAFACRSAEVKNQKEHSDEDYFSFSAAWSGGDRFHGFICCARESGLINGVFYLLNAGIAFLMC